MKTLLAIFTLLATVFVTAPRAEERLPPDLTTHIGVMVMKAFQEAPFTATTSVRKQLESARNCVFVLKSTTDDVVVQSYECHGDNDETLLTGQIRTGVEAATSGNSCAPVYSPSAMDMRISQACNGVAFAITFTYSVKTMDETRLIVK